MNCQRCGDDITSSKLGRKKWCKKCRPLVEHERNIRKGKSVDEWHRPSWKSMELFVSSYNMGDSNGTYNDRRVLSYANRELPGEASRYTLWEE